MLAMRKGGVDTKQRRDGRSMASTHFLLLLLLPMVICSTPSELHEGNDSGVGGVPLTSHKSSRGRTGVIGLKNCW